VNDPGQAPLREPIRGPERSALRLELAAEPLVADRLAPPTFGGAALESPLHVVGVDAEPGPHRCCTLTGGGLERVEDLLTAADVEDAVGDGRGAAGVSLL